MCLGKYNTHNHTYITHSLTVQYPPPLEVLHPTPKPHKLVPFIQHWPTSNSTTSLVYCTQSLIRATIASTPICTSYHPNLPIFCLLAQLLVNKLQEWSEWGWTPWSTDNHTEQLISPLFVQVYSVKLLVVWFTRKRVFSPWMSGNPLSMWHRSTWASWWHH